MLVPPDLKTRYPPVYAVWGEKRDGLREEKTFLVRSNMVYCFHRTTDKEGCAVKKTRMVIIFIAAICLSFFAGKYVSKSEQETASDGRCEQMLSFAVSKIQSLKEDYDADNMEALISNVYAAYEHSSRGSGELAGSLHDLWNALVFDGENIAGKEDALIDALEDFDAQRIEDIAISMRTKK